MSEGFLPPNTPSVLYKYRDFTSEGHTDTITEGTFWFSHADDFNDPFDIGWGFDYSASTEQKVQWAKKVVQREFPEMSEEKCEEFARERIEEIETTEGYYKDAREMHIEQTKDKVGICSLSAKPDDILMWSHYSASHTGFCVGINTSTLEQMAERRARLRSTVLDLYRVEYQNEIPTVNFFDAVKGHPSDTIDPFLTTKSDHWEYEEEYRLVLYDNHRTAYPLGIEVISEIILGCEATEEDREWARSIVDERSRAEIDLFQAQKHSSKFELNLSEVS